MFSRAELQSNPEKTSTRKRLRQLLTQLSTNPFSPSHQHRLIVCNLSHISPLLLWLQRWCVRLDWPSLSITSIVFVRLRCNGEVYLPPCRLLERIHHVPSRFPPLLPLPKPREGLGNVGVGLLALGGYVRCRVFGLYDLGGDVGVDTCGPGKKGKVGRGEGIARHLRLWSSR